MFGIEQNISNIVEIILSLVLALITKDICTSFVGGIMFFISDQFNEGDNVYVDGELSLIVKIGLIKTIFGIEKDGQYVWRYVPNSRIKFLKLEKIVNLPEIEGTNG